MLNKRANLFGRSIAESMLRYLNGVRVYRVKTGQAVVVEDFVLFESSLSCADAVGVAWHACVTPAIDLHHTLLSVLDLPCDKIRSEEQDHDPGS